jgi:hypothetical protein
MCGYADIVANVSERLHYENHSIYATVLTRFIHIFTDSFIYINAENPAVAGPPECVA